MSPASLKERLVDSGWGYVRHQRAFLSSGKDCIARQDLEELWPPVGKMSLYGK